MKTKKNERIKSKISILYFLEWYVHDELCISIIFGSEPTLTEW